ncbi:unnamed protein product [Miscanthus lutarioriparius]|uniref:Glycosyltransferase n=1 Tax=Miscanthus lutarioriparius TaxID=422564 RepID=A0A811PW42_9POAL|nr:unnamed protein product [Miscanthus lutarioriparius]
MGEEAAAPTVAAAAGSAPPHLLLICFPGQGHVNPMLRLAKRIAAKGFLVTFSSVSTVGAKLAASAGGDGVPVGRGRVRFEFLDDEDPGPDLDDLMRHLAKDGPPAFAKLLARQAADGRPVACVVVNPFMPWAADVAADAGIPSAVLWVQSCAVFSLYYHHVHGLVEFPREDDLDARFSLPGLPEMSVADVPSFLLPSNPYKLLVDAIIAQFRTIGRASWVLVNSFTELERDVAAALPGVTPRPPELIPVGPLIELDGQDDGSDGAVRGDLMKAADDCVEWLDAQPPRSVVYASVGSVVLLNAEEVGEMAHGLAATGRPFLWVVRPDTQEHLPEGFLDAVAGRGTWGDQCTDAKFLVEELRMGVRLRGGPLRRDAVREAVEDAVAGPDADAMLASARRWSAAAREAVAPGGYSDAHVQAFVDEVARRACGVQAAKVVPPPSSETPPPS